MWGSSMKYYESLEYLKLNSVSYFECKTENEFKEKYEKSNSVYLIKWNKEEVFNWGTMSPNSNRVRKSSVLNNFLTGKYDRRVDYLMFHKIYGLETVNIFKFNSKDDSRFHEEVQPWHNCRCQGDEETKKIVEKSRRSVTVSRPDYFGFLSSM